MRNSKNTPDEWEQSQLHHFEKQLSQGVEAKNLVVSEVMTDKNGTKTFRFMKAIPAGALCLKCHGANLSADVQQTINRLYPIDKATGYKQGDIRGAFTLLKNCTKRQQYTEVISCCYAQ